MSMDTKNAEFIGHKAFWQNFQDKEVKKPTLNWVKGNSGKGK